MTLQVYPVNHSPHQGAPSSPLHAAVCAAATIILGCVLVVWTVNLGEGPGTDGLRAGVAADRLDPDDVDHLKAEVTTIRAAIDRSLEQLGADAGVVCPTTPEVPLFQARQAAEETLDLLRKMENAVKRGNEFVARHFHNELRMEYRALHGYLSRARLALPAR